MPISTEERLREKGWSEEEIQRAMSSMAKASEKKEGSLLFSSSFKTFVYWMNLIILIVVNFFAAAILVPILLVMKSTLLYILIGVLGISFGLMFSIMLRDLEKIDEKRKVIGGLFIPAMAAITVYVMVDLSNSFNTILKLRASAIGQGFELHNPMIISAIYVVTFIFPYVIYALRDLSKKKKTGSEGNEGNQGGIPQQPVQQVQQPVQQYPQQYQQYQMISH